MAGRRAPQLARPKCRFPVSYQDFPDNAETFLDNDETFPVPEGRNLGSLSEILQQSRALLPILPALDPPKSGLFPVLSLLRREFDAESSSHQTGSSAIESQL